MTLAPDWSEVERTRSHRPEDPLALPLEACSTGTDDSTFSRWYEQTYPRLVAALQVLSRDQELAREVADEAFARAFERWPRVSSMPSPEGWTYRVATNVLKRRGRRAAIESRLLASVRPPPEVHAEADWPVWHAVAALPARMKLAVVLRYVADLTENDVARAMGVRPGTASALLADARHRLRGPLSEGSHDDN